jgi:uncharacterized protein (DUF1697 family)
MKENKIQANCYQWYNNNYCLKHHNPRGIMFSVPNELAGTNKIAMMQAKAMGLVSGVSDTIIILPNGNIVFCEFKDATGKQSEKQKEFESIVTNLGFEYKIIRNLEDFKTWIQSQ